MEQLGNSLKVLIEQGFHFTLVRGKAPFVKGWKEIPATLDELLAHLGRGEKIGLIPASGSMAVIDLDSAPSKEQMGDAHTHIVNVLNLSEAAGWFFQKSGSYDLKQSGHYFFKVTSDAGLDVLQAPLPGTNAIVDILHKNRQVILYDPADQLEWMVNCLDSPHHQGGQTLIEKIKTAKKHQKNTKIHPEQPTARQLLNDAHSLLKFWEQNGNGQEMRTNMALAHGNLEKIKKAMVHTFTRGIAREEWGNIIYQMASFITAGLQPQEIIREYELATTMQVTQLKKLSSYERIAKILELMRVSVYWNTRTQSSFAIEEGQQAIAIDDHKADQMLMNVDKTASELASEKENSTKIAKADFLTYLNGVEAEFDPVYDILTKKESPAKRPGGEEGCVVENLLTDYLNAPESPFTRALSIYIIITLLARLLEPGTEQREIPALIGKPRGGKSTFFNHLLTPLNLVVVGLEDLGSYDLNIKTIIERVQGGGVGAFLFDEMKGFTIKNKDAFNSLVGAPTYQARVAYGKKQTKIKPSWFWVAAANPDKIAYMYPSGQNTRLILIKCDGFVESYRSIAKILPKNALGILQKGIKIKEELDAIANWPVAGSFDQKLIPALAKWNPAVFKEKELKKELRAATLPFEMPIRDRSIFTKLARIEVSTRWTREELEQELGVHSQDSGGFGRYLEQLQEAGKWRYFRSREGDKRPWKWEKLK